MGYVSQLRQNLNEEVRDYTNKMYSGLGDVLTTTIDKRGLVALVIVGSALVATSGCTRTEAMVIGGLAGAAIGGPIGYQSGEALAGAAIGLGTGAVGGALITEE